jgi:hypothetical protein
MQAFRHSLRCSWGACSSGIWLCSTEWWVSNVSRQCSALVFKGPISQYPINHWRKKHFAVSKHLAPITQWHSATPQKNEHLKLNSVLTAGLLALLKFLTFSSHVASNNWVDIFTAQTNAAFCHLSPFTVWIHSLWVYFVMYTFNIWYICVLNRHLPYQTSHFHSGPFFL